MTPDRATGRGRNRLVIGASAVLLLGVIAVAAILPSRAVPAEAASVALWSAGMEGGNLSEWSAPQDQRGTPGGGIFNTGNGVATASTDFAHSGSYSAKMSIDTGDHQNQAVRLFRWFESRNNPEAYYSVWYYFPQSYSGMNWWNVFQWKSKLSGGVDDPVFTLNVGNRSNGEMYFYLYSEVNGNSSHRQSVKNIPVGQWFQVEAYYRQATDNTGRVTVWQDGVQILDVTGVETRRSGDEVHWSVNNYSDDINPPDATIYADDAAISTTRLGPGSPAHSTTGGAPTGMQRAAPAAQGLVSRLSADNPLDPEPSTGQAESGYFAETGFRVAESFWDYFQRRGGVRALGYPISREFLLDGFRVQLFQRGVLQAKPDGGVARMNLLDGGLMPYTRINGSDFPAPDAELIRGAPLPLDPDYAEKAVAFLQANVPDEWDGLPVGFRRAFLGTVRVEDAFPNGGGNRTLQPLLNLELWGLPTSRPAYDPNNHSFVYQRFQRGILHYDATNGTTQGILLGDYLKSLLAGRGLPADLAKEAAGNPLYGQLGD